ncbi:MAG: PLDc N-terminal domain-containing protein, partial [Rhodospirillales bacterium]|nr:PLDc N-terminal domain-containing protein [Rhodospirillales bacterium]
MPNWLLPTLLIIGEWGIRIVMVPVILRRRFESSTAMAWLLLIFFLPWVGLPVYWLVGVSFLGKRRARSHRRVMGQSQSHGRVEKLAPHVTRPPIAPEQRNMIIQAEQMSGNAIVGGNAVELLPTSRELFDQFIADLDAAEAHLHLLYYIFQPDEVGRSVAEALKRAVGRGVRCRVLVDHAGSRAFFRRGGLADE